MSWSRASTPSMSPLAMCTATTAMASTGLTRNRSSGSASSQRRNVASCRARKRGHCGHLDEVGGSLEVFAVQGVADRRRLVAVSGVPVARPPVQFVDLVALLVEQPGSQHVGEQMVVAVPKAPVVERDQEQVPALEGLEHGPTAVLARHRIAERAVQPAQDRRVEQKGPDMLRLTLQDLPDQVVDDVAVVAGEAGDEAGNVVLVPASTAPPVGARRSNLRCVPPKRRRRRASAPVPSPR